MQAVALEHRYGRPILPSFHGAWTLGGIVGAAGDPGDARPPARGRRRCWPCCPLVVLFAPFLPPRPRRSPPRSARSRCRGGRSCWSGLALVLFYMVDTAGDDLGTDVPRRHLLHPGGAGRAGDVPLPGGQRAGPAGRRRAGRRRTARCAVLRVGAVLGRRRPGRRGVRARPGRWRSLGFTLLGAGTAVIAPLSFSAAARIAGARRGSTRRSGRPGWTP